MLQIGDRFVVVSPFTFDGQFFPEGVCGEVVDRREISGDKVVIGAEWGFNLDKGHDCSGLAQDGYGWDVYENILEPKIFIKEDEEDQWDSIDSDGLLSFLREGI